METMAWRLSDPATGAGKIARVPSQSSIKPQNLSEQYMQPGDNLRALLNSPLCKPGATVAGPAFSHG